MIKIWRSRSVAVDCAARDCKRFLVNMNRSMRAIIHKNIIVIAMSVLLSSCSGGSGSSASGDVSNSAAFARFFHLNMKGFSDNGNSATQIVFPETIKTTCFGPKCSSGEAIAYYPTGTLAVGFKSGSKTYSLPIDISHATGPSALYVLVDTENTEFGSSYVEAFIEPSVTCRDRFEELGGHLSQQKLESGAGVSCTFTIGLFRNGLPLVGQQINLSSSASNSPYTTDANGEIEITFTTSQSGRYPNAIFNLNLPEARYNSLYEAEGILILSVN